MSKSNDSPFAVSLGLVGEHELMKDKLSSSLARKNSLAYGQAKELRVCCCVLCACGVGVTAWFWWSCWLCELSRCLRKASIPVQASHQWSTWHGLPSCRLVFLGRPPKNATCRLLSASFSALHSRKIVCQLRAVDRSCCTSLADVCMFVLALPTN